MKDGSRKKIKDVKRGDTVKNFLPLKETIGASVTNVVVKETTKQMYQLTLRGGRSIIATCMTIDLHHEGLEDGRIYSKSEIWFLYYLRVENRL